MTNYKAWRMPGIGKKPIWVIVDETEKIVNSNPTKEEVKGLKIFPKDNYKMSHKDSYKLCDRCNRPFEEAGHRAHYKEKIYNKWTGKLICHKCYMFDQNSKPDSSNNRRKELYRLMGKSRERTENNCIKCGKILQDEGAFKHPMREYINDKWTGHWLCYNCWYIIDYKNRPDTKEKLIKSMRDRRTGNLHDPGNILGDNCEELTAKLFGVKRLNIEYDKYSGLPNDHSPISEQISIEIGGKMVDLSGKVPQTTGRRLDSYGTWDFGNLKREWNKDFDIEVCWCISKDGLNVERLYIFWKKYIYDSEKKEGKDRIHITKNPTDAYGNPIIPKYEMSRITDEEFICKADEKWKEIINRKKVM
jgi:hypothetical protein